MVCSFNFISKVPKLKILYKVEGNLANLQEMIYPISEDVATQINQYSFNGCFEILGLQNKCNGTTKIT